jgi:ATP-dependent Lon protease
MEMAGPDGLVLVTVYLWLPSCIAWLSRSGMRKDQDWFREEDAVWRSLHDRGALLRPGCGPDADGIIECPWSLRDMVVYPHGITICGAEHPFAIEEAQLEESTVIAVNQRDPDKDYPGISDYLPIGVELAVGRLLNMPDGASSALVQARRRVEVIEYVQQEPFIIARARRIHEDAGVDRETDATLRTVLQLFERCVQLDRSLPEEAYLYALNIEEPGWLADMIAAAVSPPLEDRINLLQMLDPIERVKGLWLSWRRK